MLTIVRRLCRLILRPPLRLAWRFMVSNSGDPWERRDLGRPTFFLDRYGWFPTADYFRAYLRRPSSVPVDSLDAICAWLRECRYDELAYSKTNAWPLPNDFETSRKGTCFDHALWGWRKLIEMGVSSALVWGQFRDDESSKGWSSGHLWVQFHYEGIEYLFEPVRKDETQMVGQFAELRNYYRPWYAVDSDFHRYEYHGYAHSLLYD